MKILFRLYEPLAQKETLVQIVIHIMMNRRQYIIPTEIHIIGRVWDREKQLVQGDNNLSKAFNRRILNLKAQIVAYNKQCSVVKKAPELEEIKQLVFRKERTRLNLVEMAPVHLDEDELKRFELAPLPFERLEIARDIFLFSCYTGMPFKDIADLRASHLVFSNDYWKIIYRTKSKKDVKIPLTSEALTIVNRWSARLNTIVNNRLLPDLSSLELQRGLMVIGSLTGITKSLSQECALNTFVSTTQS